MSHLFFIAVVLPPDLNEEIKKFKMHMLERWGCKVALKSPAHITIIPPWWMEDQLEPSLLEAVHQISTGFEPFELQLQHFSAFKPRTLFVAVQQSEQLYRLKKAADHFFSNNQQYKAKPDLRTFHPHVTIATRDLHKKSFAEAWSLYETKPYERTFTVSGLSVLRHSQKDWDLIHTAPFTAQ